MERATLHQVTQVKVESTPGTAVPATVRLRSFSITPTPKVNVNKIKPKGAKWLAAAAKGKEWTEADIDGAADYNELTYLLAALIGNRVTTTPAGGVTQHVFSSHNFTQDDCETLSVENGDPYMYAEKFAYGLVQELTLTMDRDEVPVKGTMLGRAIGVLEALAGYERQTITITGAPDSGNWRATFGGQQTGQIPHNASAQTVQTALAALSTIGAGNVRVTGGPGPATPWLVDFIGDLAFTDVALLTFSHTLGGGTNPNIAAAETIKGAAPTTVELMQIQPDQISVYLDDAGAQIGNTKLSRPISIEWKVGDRQGPVWVLDRAQSSYVSTVETDPSGEITLLMQADAELLGLYAALRAGTKKFLRIEAVGPVISGGYTYKLLLDQAVFITDVGDFSDEDGVYAHELTLSMADDPTWTKSVEATLVNTVAAL